MIYDKNNLFAKIIRGEISAEKIYEDEEVLAFNDISKAAPTHILAIPKGDYLNFSDFALRADDKKIAHFFRKIGEIASLVGADISGFRLISNIGFDAHQTIQHFHVHILAGKKLGPLLSSDNFFR